MFTRSKPWSGTAVPAVFPTDCQVPDCSPSETVRGATHTNLVIRTPSTLTPTKPPTNPTRDNSRHQTTSSLSFSLSLHNDDALPRRLPLPTTPSSPALNAIRACRSVCQASLTTDLRVSWSRSEAWVSRASSAPNHTPEHHSRSTELAVFHHSLRLHHEHFTISFASLGYGRLEALCAHAC